MLRKILFILLLLSLAAVFPNQKAQALERLIKGAPAQVGALPNPQAPVAPDGPLTVIDVIVDKTAANAVLARDQAIAEAQRLAFQKLAERNLTPDAYKAFKAPDVKQIAGLVQDFEIKGERISSTRYVANFTVRFREAVRNYVPIMAVEPGIVAQDAIEGTDVGEETADAADESATGAATATADAPVLATGPAKTYLILPYIENIAGKLKLWEDPNPWRQVWQQNMPRDAANGSRYIVPMGDIADVSAGSTDAVWSGDYRAIEKLRQNYRVDEVVLAVANKSGAYMTVDMYFFRNGGLLKREVLQPYVGTRDESESFGFARGEVLKYLQDAASYKGRRTVENISRELVGRGTAAADTATPAEILAGAQMPQMQAGVTSPAPVISAGKTELEAMMSFSSPAAWMDLQKRIATISPPVRLNIRSINKGGAQFVVKYDGDISALQQALSTRGIALNQPSVQIDRSVLGGSGQGGGMKPVYGLSIVN